MNSFFKTFLACLLALVAVSILSAISFFIFVGAATQIFSSPAVEYSEGSLMEISLNEVVTDSPATSPMEQFNPSTMTFTRSLSLLSIIESLEVAAIDPKIEGIYLNLSAVQPLGMATLTAVRKSLEKFKSSGKPIYAYADYYTQGSYYIASVADKIYMSPLGNFEWKGMASQVMFFKGTLDKLGVESEIVRHGRYKSAIEPFTQTKMSDDNRTQTSELVGSVWKSIVDQIAKSRGLTVDQLNEYATDLSVTDGEKAVELGLIDAISYQEDVKDQIVEAIEQEKFKTIPLYSYVTAPKTTTKEYSANKIAVIYADGEIMDVSSGGSAKEVVTASINEKLIKARKDSTIKAVVLRINSPGGSALAADNIWSEVKRLRDKKPLIVSMGDMAASGGYYIAAPADIIIAEPTTITGSIGVFGLMFNAQKGLKDKLGITVDAVSTNPSADMGNMMRPLTASERKYMQNSVENIYDTFVAKVSQGRNLSVDAVDKIAQGRVWSGEQAAEIGLVDGFGGIDDAVLLAADRAGVSESFRIFTYSDELSPFDSIIASLVMETKVLLGGSVSVDNPIESQLLSEYQKINNYAKTPGLFTIMPYTISFE